jgi:maltose alpha-D-glucosyltransferase/alpha-amylase
MQWDDTATCGFSTAPPERLYLPVDPAADRPTIAAQRADPTSLLHTVRQLIALRRAHPGLGRAGDLEVLADGYPLAYLRGGGRYLVAVNPAATAVSVDVPSLAGARPLLADGAATGRGGIVTDGHGFGIFEL